MGAMNIRKHRDMQYMHASMHQYNMFCLVLASDGKVQFSSVQRPFCLNPELDYWFGSALSLNPKLNPWFGFKRSGSGSGRGQMLNRTPNPFSSGA